MKFINLIVLIIYSLLLRKADRVYIKVIEFLYLKNNLTVRTLTILNSINIVYLENTIRSEETLVLLHGFGANKNHWLKLVKEFKNEYHLIIPDLVGSGDSSSPLNINYTIDNHARILNAFINELPIKNLILIGSSLGGGIALKYTFLYKVKILVLISPMGIKVEDSYLDKMSFLEKKELYLDTCTKDKFKKIISLSMNRVPYIPDFIIEYLIQKKCKKSILIKYKYNAILDENLNARDDLTAIAEQINIPALIIWGSKDNILHINNAYKFNESIQNSKLIILNNIGHVPMLENPYLVAKNIINSLNNI